MIDIGIKFPDEKKLMAEETAYFKTLPPEVQIEQLVDCLRMYHSLREFTRNNPRVAQLEAEYEEQGRKATTHMAAKYGI